MTCRRGLCLIASVGAVMRAGVILGATTGLLAMILPEGYSLEASLWGGFFLSLFLSYTLFIYISFYGRVYNIIIFLLPIFGIMVNVAVRFLVLFIEIQIKTIIGGMAPVISYNTVINMDIVGINFLLYCVGNLLLLVPFLFLSIFDKS
jgi:hypothetical protein